MPETEKPTEEYIEATTKHLEDVWSGARGKWQKVDSYLNGTFPVWVDENGNPLKLNRPSSRPALPRALVDLAINTQLTYEPHFHRDAIRENETQEEASSAVENWVAAAWEQNGLNESVLSIKQAAGPLMSYGYTAMEGVYLRRAGKPENREEDRSPRLTDESEADYKRRTDEEYEQRLNDWFPFRFRAIHPSKVLLPPWEKQPSFAIKRTKQYAKDLHDMTVRKRRERKDASVDVYDYGNEPWKEITLLEYFNSRFHTLQTDGTEVAPGRHLYIERAVGGFVPFTHAFSGWGQEPVDMERLDPKYMAQGLLDPVMNTILRLAQVMSAAHAMIINAAFAKAKAPKGMDAAEAAQQFQADILEGDWDWLHYPDLPQRLENYIAELHRDIELGTFALQEGGFRPQGVVTVGQTALLMQKSGRKFQSIAKQLESLSSVIGSSFLRLADIMDEIPIVHGKRLRREAIGHRYHLRVTYEEVDPVLVRQSVEQALELFDRGLASPAYVWDAARIEDHATMRKQILEHRVEQMPAVATDMELITMEGMGMKDLADRLRKMGTQRQNGRDVVDVKGTLLSDEPANPANPTPSTAVRQQKAAATNPGGTP